MCRLPFPAHLLCRRRKAAPAVQPCGDHCLRQARHRRHHGRHVRWQRHTSRLDQEPQVRRWRRQCARAEAPERAFVMADGCHQSELHTVCILFLHTT